MVAKLTPQRGKFGFPLGQVWPKNLSWHIIIQSHFCKDQEKFQDIKLTFERSELVLRNTM